MSYGTKVIRKHDELVIAAGGKLTVEEGGIAEISVAADAASGLAAAASVQALAEALSARIKALEDAAP